MTNDPAPDAELSELEAIAAKYTDRPTELIAAIRGHLLDDIAEGLRLIGIKGGLVDMLEYAASLAHDEADGIDESPGGQP